MLNHRDRRVLTSDAAHTNCLLQLIGKEWAYLAPAIRAKKGLDKIYKCLLCHLALDKVVTLHKKLEDVKKDIKEAERGVILRINQMYQNISLAATTIDMCMPVSTTGLEAHSHCDRIVKEAGGTSPGVTVSTCMA